MLNNFTVFVLVCWHMEYDFGRQMANPLNDGLYNLGLSADCFLRVMDSGSKGRAWVENLSHRFTTFCSEADDILCQDSVKYFRTKLITARENLMHLCSELVEDVLHDFSVDSAGENGLASLTQEHDVNFPAQKMSSIGIDTDEDGRSCTVISESTLLSIEPAGERCTDIQSDGKDEVSNRFCKQTLDGDECAQPLAVNSSETAKEEKIRQISKPPFAFCTVCTRQFPITESKKHSCCQKLEESIVMVNSDECYSDSDMGTNYLSLENTKVKFCTLKRKIARKRPSESSQGLYSETDQMTEKCCAEHPYAQSMRIVNEDFCDWEII